MYQGETDEADRVLRFGLGLDGLTEGTRARLVSVQGYAALMRGDSAEARKILDTAVQRLREVGDRLGLCTALRWQALNRLREGHLDAAFESAYCSLAETRHAGLEVEAGQAHSILCVAFMQRALPLLLRAW